MSKRAIKNKKQKERNPRDLYPTPYDPCVPLLTHLFKTGNKNLKFIEPCAGDGRLITHFEAHGHQCIEAYDIEPQSPYHGVKIPVQKRDILFFGGVKFDRAADCIITNPPWSRNRDGTGLMHEMIREFSDQLDTWMLFDADWAHLDCAVPFKHLCQTIVSVGRVKWFEGTKHTSMDNCAWYKFTKNKVGDTNFVWPV